MADTLSSGMNWSGEPKPTPQTTPLPPVPAAGPVEQKKQTVSDASVMKQALYGSPQTQAAIAISGQIGSELGQTEEVQDLNTLTYTEFAQKYGPEAADARGAYLQRHQDIKNLREEERTWGETLSDGALTAAKAVGGIAGGAAWLANSVINEPVKALTGVDLNVNLAETMDGFNEMIDGNRSELMQERQALNQIQGELLKSDRQARSLRREAEAGEDPSLLSQISNTLQGWGEAAVDTAVNVGSDPIMAADLGISAIGSMIPAAGIIRAAGLARTTAVLTTGSEAMTAQAARQYLATPAGQKMLQEQTLLVAPVVSGLLESGGAGNEAIQEVLGMSDEVLRKNGQFKALVDQGATEDEARRALASQAGDTAFTTSLPGGMAAGVIAAPLAVSPVRLGAGPSLASGVSNLGKEAVEEALQEGNAQVGVNLGVADAGFERAWDEGMAEAATLGAMGGFMASGTLQSPGLARDALGPTASAAGTVAKAVAAPVVAGAKAAGSAVGRAADAMADKADAKAAEAAETSATSPVAAPARAQSAARMTEAADSFLAETPASPDAPVAPAVSEEVRETVRKGIYLRDEDAAYLAETNAAAAAFREANPDAPISRPQALEFYNEGMAETQDEATRFTSAVSALDIRDELQALTRPEVAEEIENLPEDSPQRQAYVAMRAELDVQGSSPVVARAEKLLKTITPEQVNAYFGGSMLSDPDLDPASRKQILRAIELTAGVNPQAVAGLDLEAVRKAEEALPNLSMDQMGDYGRRSAARSLAAAKAIIDSMNALDTQRENLVAASRAAGNERPTKTADIVRKEIRTTGLDTAMGTMPSLMQHWSNIHTAARTGRQDNVDALVEELLNFAQSQANKVEALNRSVTMGGQKIGYEAYGPYGFFPVEDAKGLNVATGSPGSVLFANMVHADTVMAVDMANQLSAEFGTEGRQIEVPALHPQVTIRTARIAAAQAAQAAKAAEAPKAEKKAQKPKPKTKVQPKAEPVAEAAPVEVQDAPPAPEPVAETVQEPEAEVVTEQAPAPAEEIEQDAEKADAPVVSWFGKAKETLAKGLAGANVALDHFRPARRGSTLTAHESPMRWFLQNMDAAGYTTEQKNALNSIIRNDFPAFRDAWDASAQDMLQSVEADKRARKQLFDEGLPVNLMEVDAEGKYTTNPQVIAAAYAAAQEWISTNAMSPRVKDDEGINKMFGRARTEFVSDELRAAARFGVPLQGAIEEIASKMMDLLDVQPKAGAPLKYAQGLFRAMAANAIELQMSRYTEQSFTNKAGKKQTTLTNEMLPDGQDVLERMLVGRDGKEQIMVVRVSPAWRENAENEVLRKMREPFTKVFAPHAAKASHLIGAPAAGAERSQMGNPNAKLSAAEVRAVERLQKTEHHVVPNMADLVDALGSENFLKLMGFKDVAQDEAGEYAAGHLASIEGLNQTLLSDLTNALDYVDLSRAQGSAPIFFRWGVSSVGRLQQQGPVTPQGSKLARELISATRSNLDLTNEAHRDALWLAIAQSMGVKVEAVSVDQALAEARAMVKGPLAPAYNYLRDWVQNGQKPDGLNVSGLMEVLSATELMHLNGGKEVEITPKLIHALLTAVQADLNPEATDFETFLALEADGKTDGPINAMIHMARGEFTAEDVERLAKGGLFFTGEDLSLNEFIALDKTANGKDGGKDLYHKAAGIFEARLGQWLKDGNPEFIRTLSLLDQFLPGFTLTANGEGELQAEVGRNVVKNPLTVFLYGSGVKGIAAKIAGQLIEQMQLKMTATLQNSDEFSADLVEDLGVLFFGEAADSTRQMENWLSDMANAQITGAMFESATARIMEHFAEPMMEAVDETTGGLAANMKLLQSVSQVQDVMFKAAMRTELDAVMAKRGVKLPDLTEADLKDAFVAASKVAPIYETGAHGFHIVKPRKVPVQDGPMISRSFSKRFGSRASTLTATDAGVKVSPFLTIGSGDGQMILNIYENGDLSFDRSLPVFDGVEMAVDSITEGSRQINEQVARGWFDNVPMEAVLEGLEQMLRHVGPKQLEALTKTEKAALSQALGQKKGDVLDVAVLSALHAEIRDQAMENRARKMAMSRMALSVDHMASAQSPHLQQGEIVAEGNPLAFEEIAAQLETFRQEAMAELKRQRGERAAKGMPKAAYYQQPTKGVAAALKWLGQPVEGHKGVRRVMAQDVLGLLQNREGVSAEQFHMMRDLIEASPLPQDTVFYFGSAKDLTALRDSLPGDLPKTPIELGQSFTRSNEVFIANASPETILHETIHLLTARTLQQHYEGKAPVAEHARYAIERLEELADQAENLRIPASRGYDRQAFQHLQTELRKAQNNPTKRIAELIAYALSNQDIIEAAKDVRSFDGLRSIVQKAARLFRKMLGIKATPGNTFYSNLRFNTLLLTAPAAAAKGGPLTDAEINLSLNQAYPNTSEQVQKIGQLYFSRLRALWKDQKSGLDRNVMRLRLAKLRRAGRDSAQAAAAVGFNMGTVEARAYEAVHAAVMADIPGTTEARQKAYKAFTHVMAELSAEKIAQATGLTQATAARMFDHLTNWNTDAEGRTELLARFIALSQTSDEMRQILSAIEPPKVAKTKWESVNDWLNNTFASFNAGLMRTVGKSLAGGSTMTERLDLLAQALAELQEQRQLDAVLNKTRQLGDMVNGYAAEKLNKGAKSLTERLEKAAENATNSKAKGAFSAAALVTAFASKDAAPAAAESLSSMLNVSPKLHTLRAAFNDLVGMTDATAALVRLINPAKAAADVVRQDFREGVPAELQARFKTAPTTEQWEHMHLGFGRADILALGRDEATALLNDMGTLADRIAQAEEQLDGAAGRLGALMKEKAKALAHWSVRRENTSRHLLPNAYAIARLAGTPYASRAKTLDTAAVEKAVDRLATLYAVDLLPAKTKTELSQLTKAEQDGVGTVLGFLDRTRGIALEQGRTGVARMNGWKGYVPTTKAAGHSVLVLDDLDAAAYEAQGYQRVGNYHGDRAEGYVGKRGYYVSTVAGKSAYRQGVAQLIHSAWQGVDLTSGRTQGGDMAGAIYGSPAKDVTKTLSSIRGKADGLRPDVYLIPRFSEAGTVVAYERPMDAAKINEIPRDAHLGRMLGVWAGRLVEEAVSTETNQGLMTVLKDAYEQAGKKGQLDQFVNIADPESTDPVHQDVFNSLSRQVKEMATETFGADQLWVRRDMVDRAFGYRSASVTDAWTGVSRFSPETQRRIRGVADAILGEGAYAKLKKAEDQVQGLVSFAKTTIIIRSMRIVVDNIASNFLHLSLQGMDPITIGKKSLEKLKEIHTYTRNRDMQQKLQVQIAALPDGDRRKAALNARFQALEEANLALSIAPLIKAGEFTTVSENLTEADVAIREGRWADHIEKVADRLPEWSHGAVKNLLITKDSAMFLALNRATQYGDFVAKAVLYEHLTETQGKKQREALDTIMEEFVMYNALPGRGRDYLESMGMLWFWNYKLRIMKVLMRSLRDRPLTALMTMSQTGPHLGMDTVWSGSLAGNIADGSVSFSLGPQMGIQSPTMHPIWAAID